MTASGLRLVAGLLLSPLRLLDLSDGVGGVIENFVDAPLWVADPLLYGLIDGLPALLGGGEDGGFDTLRYNLWALTSSVNELFQDLLPAETSTTSTSSVEDTALVAKVPDVTPQAVVEEVMVTPQKTRAADVLPTKAPALIDDDADVSGDALTVTDLKDDSTVTTSVTEALDTSIDVKDDDGSDSGLVRDPIVQATPGQGATQPGPSPTVGDETDDTVSPTGVDATPGDTQDDDKSTADDEVTHPIDWPPSSEGANWRDLPAFAKTFGTGFRNARIDTAVAGK